jgi:AcrR family transcriptional regulator
LTGENDTVAAAPDCQRSLSHSPKSAKKRDAILRAATEIINIKGYALATMTEIAAALDLRDAALYYYFPNKQALVFACHQSSLGALRPGPERKHRRWRNGFERLERFLAPCSWSPPAMGPCSISATAPIWTKTSATRSPPAANI